MKLDWIQRTWTRRALGDLNAMVGKEGNLGTTVGKFSLLKWVEDGQIFGGGKFRSL